MPVGKRIYLKQSMPDRGLMEEFTKLPASNVADCIERSCAMNPRIRLISKGKPGSVCGPAFPSRTGRCLLTACSMPRCGASAATV